MQFSSSVFLFLFLPVVLLGYYVICPLFGRWRMTARNTLLLIASLLFYAWGEPWFVLAMIGSILVNYLFGLWIDARKRRERSTRLPVVLSLICNLGFLFLFKYLVFTIKQLNRVGLDLTVPEIALPLGISFFTFQAISYVLDVNSGSAPVQKNPFKVGLYISLFPQLIAGPIVKYNTVAAEIDGRKESWNDFSIGVCRLIYGLFKKVFIANQLALAADFAFDSPAGLVSTGMAWLGMIAYSLQIYFDFSGYSDMAIGLGRMFGFHFHENFSHPYISTSITEFWRRWHISLSSWFRDYVYIPLGGNRVDSTGKHLRNLFVVWLLTGIWHGANWTFIVWGLYYFVLLVIEKYTHLGERLPVAVRWLGTTFLVFAGWVFFRSVTLSSALHYLSLMFIPTSQVWDGYASLFLTDNLVVFVLAVLLSTPLAEKLTERAQALTGVRAAVRDVLIPCVALLTLVVVVSFIIKGTYNPFIYSNF